MSRLRLRCAPAPAFASARTPASSPSPSVGHRVQHTTNALAAAGFTLVELTLVMALLSLAAVWAAGTWVQRIEDAGAQAVARWLLAVESAAEPARLALEDVERGRPGAVLPPALAGGITLAALKQAGYLDAGFPELSAWNRGLRFSVLRTGTCPGMTCGIRVLAHTDAGPDTLDPGRLADRVGAVLLAAQGRVGAVHARDAERLRGPVFNLANPPAPQVPRLPAGTLAVLLAGGAAQDEPYVRRRDLRDPELAGPLTVAGATVLGEDVQIGGSLNVLGTSIQAWAAQVSRDLQVGGELRTAGRVTAQEYLQIEGQAVAGARCPITGLMGRNARGVLLNCDDGYWAHPDGGFGGTYVERNGRVCVAADGSSGANPRVGRCGCPAGYSARLVSVLGAGGPAAYTTYLCQR